MPLLTSERRNCEPLKSWKSRRGREGGKREEEKEEEKEEEEEERRRKKNTKRGTFLRFQPDDLSMKSTLCNHRYQKYRAFYSDADFFLPSFKSVLSSATSSFFFFTPFSCLVVDGSLIEIGQSSWWTVLRLQQEMYREGVARFSRSASTVELYNRSFGRKFFSLPFHVSRM